MRQATPVSRDDVAGALGLARATAAFHLDRLVADGLLDIHFERRSGRTGPGAGRPAKLYRRSDVPVEVSLMTGLPIGTRREKDGWWSWGRRPARPRRGS